MILIPLYYYGIEIGKAKVDEDLCLHPKWQWRIIVPSALRAHRLSPDVLLATIREDDSVRHKCVPMTTWSDHGRFIHLAKVIFRPQVIQAMNNIIALPHGSPRKESLAYEVTNTLKSVRVIYVNGDRTDCRKENLREVLGDIPQE